MKNNTADMKLKDAGRTPLGRLFHEERRYRQDALAAALGCDYRRLRLLLEGQRELTASEIAAAAAFFGVPVDTFVQPVEVAS